MYTCVAFGTSKVRACLRPFLTPNISETTGDRKLFTIGSIYESGQEESNGDVTDDVAWPADVTSTAGVPRHRVTQNYMTQHLVALYNSDWQAESGM